MRKAGLYNEKAAFLRARGAVFEGITEDDFYANTYSTGVGIPAYPN